MCAPFTPRMIAASPGEPKVDTDVVALGGSAGVVYKPCMGSHPMSMAEDPLRSGHADLMASCWIEAEALAIPADSNEPAHTRASHPGVLHGYWVSHAPQFQAEHRAAPIAVSIPLPHSQRSEATQQRRHYATLDSAIDVWPLSDVAQQSTRYSGRTWT